MRYKSQLVTIILVVETAPPEAYNPGAITYVSIPKDFNVFRVSIRNDENTLGTFSSVPGLFSNLASENTLDYSVIRINDRENWPFMLESRNGYIVDGFYLAVNSVGVGDGCMFHILFEGEIEE